MEPSPDRVVDGFTELLDGVGSEEGYFHREIQDASFEYQERIEIEEETVVGVNKYEIDEDTTPEVLHVDDEFQERQRERLAEVKDERDDAAIEEALEKLRETEKLGENTMPAILEAVKVGATMGEIIEVFEVYDDSYRETVGVV